MRTMAWSSPLPKWRSVSREREVRSMLLVVMFSPRSPGEILKEGCLEEGEERWLNRMESMRWTCRAEVVGVLAQLG